MSEFVTCPACGARNGSEAIWCSMCFESLASVPADQPAATEPAPEPAPEVSSGSVVVADRTPDAPDIVVTSPEDASLVADSSWTCGTCETVNPISRDVCSVCGTTIFQTMGAETDDITMSAEEGIRLGLIPGLAHGRLGEPVLGFIIALLVAACLVFAALLVFSGGGVWGVIVGLVGLLTWAVSVFDVNQRIAGGSPILRPRIMTIIGGVVIVVIMIAGFVAGTSAVGSPTP